MISADRMNFGNLIGFNNYIGSIRREDMKDRRDFIRAARSYEIPSKDIQT
jgi:hypothetical protein